MTRRVDRDVALRLLAASGTTVTLIEHELVEDVNGDPLGIDSIDAGSGMLYVTPDLLGWTAKELGLDEDADA